MHKNFVVLAHIYISLHKNKLIGSQIHFFAIMHHLWSFRVNTYFESVQKHSVCFLEALTACWIKDKTFAKVTFFNILKSAGLITSAGILFAFHVFTSALLHFFFFWHNNCCGTAWNRWSSSVGMCCTVAVEDSNANQNIAPLADKNSTEYFHVCLCILHTAHLSPLESLICASY